MTDFRALCAELLKAWEIELGDLHQTNRLCKRARAALAQPEPQGPTDEELEATARAAEILSMKEQGGLTSSTLDGIHAQLQEQRLAGLRAVATRWGRPAIKPIPVSERLPGPADCDEEGRCWWFDRECDSWSFSEGRLEEETHWAAHWAMPVPQQEAGQ